MRKTAQNLIAAYRQRKSKSCGNSAVTCLGTEGAATFTLHGHPIVRVSAPAEDGVHYVEVSLCGWPTPTTRSRINDVLHGIGAKGHVFQKDFTTYLLDQRGHIEPMSPEGRYLAGLL